jgi:hypothetical protein
VTIRAERFGSAALQNGIALQRKQGCDAACSGNAGANPLAINRSMDIYRRLTYNSRRRQESRFLPLGIYKPLNFHQESAGHASG